jgi:hypothetical protein
MIDPEKLKKLSDAMDKVDKIMKDKTFIHKSNSFQSYKYVKSTLSENPFLWLDEQILMINSLDVVLNTFVNNRFIYDIQSILDDLNNHISHIENVCFDFDMVLVKSYYENPKDTILKCKLLYQNIYDCYDDVIFLNKLKEKNIEVYDKYIFFIELLKDLFNSIKNIIDLEFNAPFDIKNSSTKSPFRDEKSKKLFEFIVNNWSNSHNTKWGYIWDFMVLQENGKLTNKTEYEAFVREKYNFLKGKMNFDSCNSSKRFEELEELKQKFLDLN